MIKNDPNLLWIVGGDETPARFARFLSFVVPGWNICPHSSCLTSRLCFWTPVLILWPFGLFNSTLTCCQRVRFYLLSSVSVCVLMCANGRFERTSADCLMMQFLYHKCMCHCGLIMVLWHALGEAEVIKWNWCCILLVVLVLGTVLRWLHDAKISFALLPEHLQEADVEKRTFCTRYC